MEFNAVTVLQITLAVIAIALGTIKALRPYEDLVGSFTWLKDVSPEASRGVGWAEVLFGAGLVMPSALGFSSWIVVGVAAVFAGFMMVVATLYAVRREHIRGVPSVGLVVASLVLMVGLV